MRDQQFQRYVRYLNYAEELRVIAADIKDNAVRESLARAADDYEQMAASLNTMFRTNAPSKSETAEAIPLRDNA